MNTSQRKLRIQTLCPNKVSEAARFLGGVQAAGLSEREWISKFKIMWDQNPFFNGQIHVRGWVVLDDEDTILGLLGNIPFQYSRSGIKESSYCASTWFVAERARTYSLGLFRKFMDQKGVLFVTTPSPVVEAIISKRLKFVRLDAEWIKTDFVLPVSLAAGINFVRWRPGSYPILKFFAWPICALIKGFTWWRTALGRLQSAKSVEVKQISELPSDLDSWWLAFERLHCYTLVRDRASMKWLFFAEHFPEKSRKVLEVRRDSTLLGFVSLKLIRQSGFSLVEVVDWALLDLEERMLVSIIFGIKQAAHGWDRDVAFVRMNAFNSSMGELLSRAGFWKLRANVRYYYFDHAHTIPIAMFHSTPIDGDKSLFP